MIFLAIMEVSEDESDSRMSFAGFIYLSKTRLRLDLCRLAREVRAVLIGVASLALILGRVKCECRADSKCSDL